jgi:hypothetical protein
MLMNLIRISHGLPFSPSHGFFCALRRRRATRRPHTALIPKSRSIAGFKTRGTLQSTGSRTDTQGSVPPESTARPALHRTTSCGHPASFPSLTTAQRVFCAPGASTFLLAHREQELLRQKDDAMVTFIKTARERRAFERKEEEKDREESEALRLKAKRWVPNLEPQLISPTSCLHIRSLTRTHTHSHSHSQACTLAHLHMRYFRICTPAHGNMRLKSWCRYEELESRRAEKIQEKEVRTEQERQRKEAEDRIREQRLAHLAQLRSINERRIEDEARVSPWL